MNLFHSKGLIVITMDDDGENSAEKIKNALAKLNKLRGITVKKVSQSRSAEVRKSVSDCLQIIPLKRANTSGSKCLDQLQLLIPSSKVVKQKDVPDELLRDPPVEGLMVLDDYCLMEIFDILKPADLSKIAFVNKRLNALTKTYIQNKYHIRFAADFHLASDILINLDILETFLHIFGDEITALTLTRSSFDHTFNDYSSMAKILYFIQNCCTNLKEFTLKGFGTCGFNHKFFEQLNAFTLEKCSVTRDWCKMTKLEKLELNQVIFRRWPVYSHGYREYGGYRQAVPIPVDCFGRLKVLRLIDVNMGNDVMKKLINSNRSLEVLSIVKCLEVSDYLFEHLKNLSHLKELEFKKSPKTSFPTFVRPLTIFKKLKVFKFTYSNYSVSELLNGFINNGVAIEHLELGGGRFDDASITCFEKLQTIKVLHLNGMFGLDETKMLSIAKNLKLLEEFQIKRSLAISRKGIVDFTREANRLTCLKVDSTGAEFNIETYQAILTAIQEHEHPTILELTVYKNGDESMLLNEILEGQNEKRIVVKEVNRESVTAEWFEDLTSKVTHAPPQRYHDSSDEYDDDY